jgi:hypothetical protein
MITREGAYMSARTLPLLSEIERRLNILDYRLSRDVVDSMGRPWQFMTFPVGSGSIGYYNSKKELLDYVMQVEFVRGLWR